MIYRVNYQITLNQRKPQKNDRQCSWWYYRFICVNDLIGNTLLRLYNNTDILPLTTSLAK